MPTWKLTIDLTRVFHNDDMTFAQRRDAIVREISGSEWGAFPERLYQPGITYLLDELALTEDVREFDEVWSAVYDLADIDRVWLET